MECLAQSIQPYREVIGQVASIVTICQFFAGTLICKDIYEKKTTKGVPATPFIGGVVIGILMLKLAYLMNDSAMFQVNVAAVILNSLYSTFYYQYSQNKFEEVLKPAAIGAALCAVFLGYANWEDPMKLEYRYGLLMTIMMLLLLAAPLLDVKEMIEKKDASAIPFPLTFMGALVTFLWLFYGIAIENGFMVLQNVVGFGLCIVQLYLLWQYPGSGQDKKDLKKKL